MPQASALNSLILFEGPGKSRHSSQAFLTCWWTRQQSPDWRHTQMTVKPEVSSSSILRKVKFCPAPQTTNKTPLYLGGKSSLEEIPG